MKEEQPDACERCQARGFRLTFWWHDCMWLCDGCYEQASEEVGE